MTVEELEKYMNTNDYISALKAENKKFKDANTELSKTNDTLSAENVNLLVKNEVLKRDRDNLERTLEEANEEIADYQSKVENGYLVELPCKVGDSICSFRLNGDKKLYVYSGKVNQIVFNTKGILIRSSVFRDFYYEESFGDLSEPYIDMEKFYLCSKEEAEEKAKRCKVE
jgi:hypothetical protein